MSHPIFTKQKAIYLRKRGFSLKEVSEKLNVSKSTASLWLSSISLSIDAQKRLQKKQILGQYKTVLLKRRAKEKTQKDNAKRAIATLKKIMMTKDLLKLCCALMWWCEGNKTTTYVKFTNSDVSLIMNFLFTLRNGFDIDEGKFRALIHLHTYHNDERQKKFWRKITNIPLSQFHKSFQKTSTHIRTKENYPGCIAITYYDAGIAKELEAIYNAFSTEGAFVNG